ncbi:unnamed protein product [Dracunculus medinensis]|uniref:MBD domain-containing protein n=1 Tax=Dracunculus medinensis TaxID=318479 RepID=A0A158Q3Q3_DRAME|nr:unnamed protein product [Dracunculus medinensis]
MHLWLGGKVIGTEESGGNVTKGPKLGGKVIGTEESGGNVAKGPKRSERVEWPSDADMKTKTNDPHYLKCPIKYDWDIASGETSSKVIAKISSFLQANGFVRNKKITRWKAKAKEKKENEEGEASSHHSDQTSELAVRDKSSEICEKSTSHIRKSSSVCIGLQSVLRRLQRNELSAIFIDSSVIQPTAIATTLGLASQSFKTNFYAVEGLSDALSVSLNMKSVSAVGLTNSADVEEIRSIASLLLVPRRSTLFSTLNSTSTELIVSAGKGGQFANLLRDL